MNSIQIEEVQEALVKKIKTLDIKSDECKSIIALLPSLILDIVLFSNTTVDKFTKCELVIDRVVNSSNPNYLYEKAKGLYRVLYFATKKQKIFLANSIISKPIKKIAFDTAYYDIHNCCWENKDIENVYRSSVTYFFIGKITRYKTNQAALNLSSQIIDVILSFFSKDQHQSLSSELSLLFSQRIYYSILATIERLKTCRKLLPCSAEEIYLPTLHSPFNRILALVQIERKSTVISLDHGIGISWIGCKTAVNNELDLANQYITHSKLHKTSLIKLIDSRFRPLNFIKPKIISSYKLNQNSKLKPYKSLNKILYISSLISDKPHSPPLDPPANYIQWQINIIRKLIKIDDYQVYLREHPESLWKVPDIILQEFHIETLSACVEDLPNHFIYVIDNPQTSCFKHAILNNIPVVCISLKSNLLYPEILDEINKSPNIRYLKAKFLNQGTLYIDEFEIYNAIASLQTTIDLSYKSELFN